MADMIRPAWTPDTTAQRRALDDAVREARRADRAVEQMWAAILAARQAGIPDTVICERTGQSRATLNRRYGRRSTT